MSSTALPATADVRAAIATVACSAPRIGLTLKDSHPKAGLASQMNKHLTDLLRHLLSGHSPVHEGFELNGGKYINASRCASGTTSCYFESSRFDCAGAGAADAVAGAVQLLKRAHPYSLAAETVKYMKGSKTAMMATTTLMMIVSPIVSLRDAVMGMFAQI